MTMKTKIAAVLAASLSLTALPALAHHAINAQFDPNKVLEMSGALVKVELINPHSWFHIEVKSPTGEVVEWMVEGGSPNSLIRVGVTKYSLQVGMELTVEGYRAKDASNTAVGRNFTLPDGKRLFVGSAGGPDAPPAK